MATVRVTPLPDSVDQRYGWQVQKSGSRVSQHTKKSAAMRKAKRVANAGDDFFVHGSNGRVLRKVTKQ